MDEKAQKRRSPQFYSEEFKLRVCKEIAAGLITKNEAIRKYDIRHMGGIASWLRQFGYADSMQIRRRKISTIHTMPEKTLSVATDDSLVKAIVQLRKDLADAEYKAEAYFKMIDIAEKEFNIEIRKKSVTKQSLS